MSIAIFKLQDNYDFCKVFFQWPPNKKRWFVFSISLTPIYWNIDITNWISKSLWCQLLLIKNRLNIFRDFQTLIKQENVYRVSLYQGNSIVKKNCIPIYLHKLSQPSIIFISKPQIMTHQICIILRLCRSSNHTK